jgi:transitional endoplasmic reticulum ATPase
MSPLKVFQEALRQSPENIPLLLLYGRACLEELQMEDAVGAYEKAVELDPRHTDAQLGLARALLLSGDASKAAVRAELVLQQDPQCAAAHLMLSRVHLAEGDKTRARHHFNRAAQIDSSALDVGLEKDLGQTLLEARRAQQSGTGAGAGPQDGGGKESGGESGPVGFGGEGGSELDDEMFMDEPPYDWRPETFWMPGDPERERVTFEDIGGLEAVKEEVRRKIVYPLQQPELHRAYGRPVGGAMLFYGPPGCGKTMLLRAVAGEAQCNYLAVGLHEIFDPYFGSTERNLHQMFETARLNAPCVLVIDGLDSLAQDRRQVRESQLRNVVNQLLHEMDALRAGNHRVLVLAATSQPWSLDPALCRPGRFEQSIFVPPPDEKTREEILRDLAVEKPLGQVDYKALVKATEGFSGADLRWVLDRAAELTLGEAVAKGHAMPIPGSLLLKVAQEHQPTTRDWFEGMQSVAAEAVTERSWMTSEVKKFAERSSKR